MPYGPDYFTCSTRDAARYDERRAIAEGDYSEPDRDVDDLPTREPTPAPCCANAYDHVLHLARLIDERENR